MSAYKSVAYKETQNKPTQQQLIIIYCKSKLNKKQFRKLTEKFCSLQNINQSFLDVFEKVLSFEGIKVYITDR